MFTLEELMFEPERPDEYTNFPNLPVHHHLYRYNFPANAANYANLHHTLEMTPYKVYLGPHPDKVCLDKEPGPRAVLRCGDILVDKLVERFFTEEYLMTPITGKDVYVPISGCGYWLYTDFELKYQVVEAGQEWERFFSVPYAKVRFTTEATLADLYRHCWWYSYNWHTGEYLEIPEQGKTNNLMRYRLQYDILTLAGTAEDRLADYGRIISFLLSKVALSDQEKRLIKPFLDAVPDHETLAALADKEGAIRNKVAFAHADPSGYLRS